MHVDLFPVLIKITAVKANGVTFNNPVLFIYASEKSENLRERVYIYIQGANENV